MQVNSRKYQFVKVNRGPWYTSKTTVNILCKDKNKVISEFEAGNHNKRES